MSQQAKSLTILAAALPAIAAGLTISYLDDWRYRTGTLEIPLLIFILSIGLLNGHRKTVKMALIWITACVVVPGIFALIAISVLY
ncbi:hypothetical protein [Agrobacterium rosae]